MDKSIKIYIAFLTVLLLLIAVVDSNKVRPIDWSTTFGVKDKIPFGLYILNKELPTLTQNDNVRRMNVSFYEYLQPFKQADSTNIKLRGTFLTISNFNDIDNESATDLLQFVANSNDAFLSMNDFPQVISDSLKIDLKFQPQSKDSVFCWMANPKFGNAKYNLEAATDSNYFSKIDTLNTTILGYHNGDSTRVNFIKVKYKNGNFFLHTLPGAFTNYSLLKKNNHRYAANVLSYLPKKTIFWNLNGQNGEEISQNPLRYILAQPALKAAWFLFLIGMLIFMIFNAKRKQRVVPILVSDRNTTVDFVKTIGNLYYNEGNHDNLMQKKIIYFLDKIRRKFMVDTSVLDDNFVKKLQNKSGKSAADIQNVVFNIKSFQINEYACSEKDLINLNEAIEKLNI